MVHTVEIAVAFQRDFVLNVHDCFRVTLTAQNAVGMPNEIFAYRVVPLQPGQPEAVAAFSHVCSPVDLAEYPIGTPLPNASPPWFRLAHADILTRTRDQAEATVADFKDAVAALCRGLSAADILVAQPVTVIGV